MAKDWRNLSLSPELLEALKLPSTQAEALKRIAATWPRPLSPYQRQEVQKVRAELARVKRDQASLQEYARVLEDWLVERELGRPVSNPPAPAIGPDAPAEQAETVAELAVEPIDNAPATDSSLATKSKPTRPPTRLQQRIKDILQYLYPPPPEVPPEDKVRRGDLIRAVTRNWDCEQVLNLEKLTSPSPDTIGRVIDDLRSKS
jgi:hypothetical protein